jgi:hypothetical protein
MNTETSKTVKLLIEAGMVPQNVVHQLVQWKLLPRSYESLGGESKIERSSDEFVSALRDAIQEDTAMIRETEFDRVGGFQTVMISGDSYTQTGQHFVDRLGRVILPAEYKVEPIKAMAVSDGPPLDVIRTEPRYEGEKQVAWVCYLAERETNVEETASKAN